MERIANKTILPRTELQEHLANSWKNVTHLPNLAKTHRFKLQTIPTSEYLVEKHAICNAAQN